MPIIQQLDDALDLLVASLERNYVPIYRPPTQIEGLNYPIVTGQSLWTDKMFDTPIGVIIPTSFGSTWENGYIESFNRKLRDELLNRVVFHTLEEVQVLTERWRQEYNYVRAHSALGYRSPVPETILVRQPIPELVTLT